ncbi:MAG: 3-phosphoshikimate 1-carboxyvinyltransferase, partial [Clostridia bacterium]|nr:3-phosphoshikimate 1-carboxyvinyltransferase [Clostridia bacterium]
MKVRILPSVAHGSISVPPSKSMAHRALIAAALAEGESLLSPIALSRDMIATMNGLTALGAAFSREGDCVRVRGFGKKPSNLGVLNCIESGSTLRFLLPICLLTGEDYTLEGAPRLMERPLSVYEKLCE